MKEYTAKDLKLLKANPYTFKITKTQLFYGRIQGSILEGLPGGERPKEAAGRHGV